MEYQGIDRKSVVQGKSVDLGGRRIIKKIFFSSRRRHTRLQGDWSSDVCSSDLKKEFQRQTGIAKQARQKNCKIAMEE